ncbi:MAG: hypothetical protein ACR2NF_09945 [Pirellulales bacterium]
MIVSTKGILDENNIKHFHITDSSGDVYIALRQPNGKFTVGDDGVHRTLKQCKDAIVNDAVVFFADKQEDEPAKTWDCVDANALLILTSAGGVSMEEIKRTLNANGWLLPSGEPDVMAARENYSKWSKR